MKFKVGDKVLAVRTNGTISDRKGQITHIENDHIQPYHVTWITGKTYAYREQDLILLEDPNSLIIYIL